MVRKLKYPEVATACGPPAGAGDATTTGKSTVLSAVVIGVTVRAK